MRIVPRPALVHLSALVVLGRAVAGCGAPPSPNGDAPEVVSFHDEGLLDNARGNALSPAEVRIVVKLVDDICGDTWCEGDYDFRFRHVFCDSNTSTCSLVFQMTLRDSAASASHWRWASCRTGGFLGFDSLVETTSDGHQWLADAYYQSLSACIGQLENTGDPADPS